MPGTSTELCSDEHFDDESVLKRDGASRAVSREAPAARRPLSAWSAALPSGAAKRVCAAGPSCAGAARPSRGTSAGASDEASGDASATSKKARLATEPAPARSQAPPKAQAPASAQAKGGKRRAAASATNVRAHPLGPVAAHYSSRLPLQVSKLDSEGEGCLEDALASARRATPFSICHTACQPVVIALHSNFMFPNRLARMRRRRRCV